MKRGGKSKCDDFGMREQNECPRSDGCDGDDDDGNKIEIERRRRKS